jgi:lipoprotein signal peptidase
MHYDVKKYPNASVSENQDPASVEIRANANANTSKIIGIYNYSQGFSFLDGSAYFTTTVSSGVSLSIYIRMEEYRKSLVTRQILLLLIMMILLKF